MKKIFINAMVPILFLSLSLCGCRRDDSSARGGSPVELVVESRLFEPPEEQAFLREEILKEFEETYHCTVRFTAVNDDTLLKKAQFQRESGKVTTDVIAAHDGIMSEWIRRDYVIPLPVKEWTDRTFSKAFRHRISSAGRTYFAPVAGDVYLTLINKDALPYKPAGVDPQGLTWEQYVDWAVAVAQQTGRGRAGVTGRPHRSLIYMYGGVFLSYGGAFPVINSLEALEGWELMVRMQKAYAPEIGSYDNMTEPLMNGQVWMTVAHMGRVGEAYQADPDRYILAPAPRGPKGIGTIAGMNGFAVVKGAPHRELALAFVKFMTDPDRVVRIARGVGGFIPPINESLDRLGSSPGDEIIAQGIRVLKTGIVSGVPGEEYTFWSEVKEVYEEAFRELVLKRGAVDKAYLDRAQERLDDLRR